MLENLVNDRGKTTDMRKTLADADYRKMVRLAALLLTIGVLLSLGVGLLHPSREAPNDHPAVFAEYAASDFWTAVHLGQFFGQAVIIAGLITLSGVYWRFSTLAGWVARAAAIASGINLGLNAVLQAVDGVALKRAVVAWVTAPAAEKAARFASAETVRWLEEAIRSYQDILLAAAFFFLAVVILWKAQIPRPIGVLFALTGVSYLVQGWFLGEQGFSNAHGTAQLPGYFFLLVAMIWLVIVSLRTKDQARSTGG